MEILFENDDLLAINKPAGLVVFPEGGTSKDETLIDCLVEEYPELKKAGEAPRYGIVHRLDKDTSGVLLVAKSTESLLFLQKQFINREVEKKYVCLVEGAVKDDFGTIKTLVARSPKDKRKQKVYLESEPHPPSAREALTEYKVLERFKNFTLLEVQIKTGRRHQIRCHFSYLQHPVAGDKFYGFKNSKPPKGLTRQFLHAQKLKIQLPFGSTQGEPEGQVKEFSSDLPEELKKVLNNLER